MGFRSEEQVKKYAEYRALGNLDNGCKLCEKDALTVFNHWKIIPNDFPYDKIAKVHHMIVPKRHTVESDISDDERGELFELKDGYINENYDFIFEASQKLKTIPAHFHLHLIMVKD